jgi:hypothetical protein
MLRSIISGFVLSTLYWGRCIDAATLNVGSSQTYTTVCVICV